MSKVTSDGADPSWDNPRSAPAEPAPPPLPRRNAAREGDFIGCVVADHKVPDKSPVVSKASGFDVYIEGKLAAAQCDETTCSSLTLGADQPGTITSGFGLVRICGMPAARIYDTMSHGGLIITGADQVFVGPAFTEAEMFAAAVALAQAVNNPSIASRLGALAAAGKIRMEEIDPSDVPDDSNYTQDSDGHVTSYRDQDGNLVVDPRYSRTPGDAQYNLAENERQDRKRGTSL